MTLQIWTDLRSDSLGMRTSLTVITPEGTGLEVQAWPDKTPGLLILLHGLTGNSMVWPQRDDLSRLASKHNLVIALPNGERSFWIDQQVGLRWGKWVGEELPALLRSTLRVSRSRKQTFVAGLSMGGYGAMRAAFDYPQTFGGVIALSGTLDVAEEAFRQRHPDLYAIGFGNPASPRPQDDLVARLRTGNAPVECLKQMSIFACCGTQDQLLEQGRRFTGAARQQGIDIQWNEGPGGHTFEFWNHWLPRGLEAVVQKQEVQPAGSAPGRSGRP